jgi:hypothetical protein
MYVTTNAAVGDTHFTNNGYAGALIWNTNLTTSFCGVGTQAVAVIESGVNDIIVMNNHWPDTSVLPTNLVIGNYRDAVETFRARNMKVVGIAIYDVIGFNEEEEANRLTINSAISDIVGPDWFLETDSWLKTNLAAGYYNASFSELTDKGNSNVAWRVNQILNRKLP